jgi:hypothetical protein
MLRRFMLSATVQEDYDTVGRFSILLEMQIICSEHYCKFMNCRESFGDGERR